MRPAAAATASTTPRSRTRLRTAHLGFLGIVAIIETFHLSQSRLDCRRSPFRDGCDRPPKPSQGGKDAAAADDDGGRALLSSACFVANGHAQDPSKTNPPPGAVATHPFEATFTTVIPDPPKPVALGTRKVVVAS